MEVVLKLLMLTFIARTLAEICPFFEDTIWELQKYKLDCRNGTTYHCRVYREQPIHFCHSILVCPPGFFATLDQDEPSPTLQCVPCPDDRFDPEESSSNKKSECQFIRQKCHISDHKIRWKQGNATADDMCYCDYRAGYEMDADSYDTIPQTSIKICDGVTRCECRQTLRCNSFSEKHMCLLPDKTCTEPCPPGYTRPYLSFGCVDKESLNINTSANPQDMPSLSISTPTPKTTLTFPFTIFPGNVQTPPKSARETTRNTTENSNSKAVLIVIVVLGCSTLAVIVMIAISLRRKCCSASGKGKEKGDAQHTLENLQRESQPMVNAETDTANNVDELNLDIRP